MEMLDCAIQDSQVCVFDFAFLWEGKKSAEADLFSSADSTVPISWLSTKDVGMLCNHF